MPLNRYSIVCVFAFCLIANLAITEFAFGKSRKINPFSVGASLGRPTGLSGKYWLGRNKSVASVLGWSESHISTHLDYRWHKSNVFKIDNEPFGTFYGIGLSLREVDKKMNENELRIGGRAPFGVRYRVKDPRLEFFGELALGLDVIPSTDFRVDFAIGVRYIFL